MRRVRKQMTVDDFLFVMARNAGVWPEYDCLSEEQKKFVANVNICTGVAESYYDEDGNIFMVGGIRYIGIGEGWFATVPERRHPLLLRTALENFIRIRDDKNLWRIYAESKISENFLESLGFRKKEGSFIWTRGV